MNYPVGSFSWPADPMDLLAAPHNIPLHCNICDKKPDFSDVSHLLTHVASKGHLSSYYKMKVRSGSDSAARKAVQEYDEWYTSWSVDDLMRERMNQKEKKRTSGGGGGGATRRGSAGQSREARRRSVSVTLTMSLSSATSASSRSTPVAVNHGRRATRRLRDSVLNPQLDPRIKVEPLSRSGTPASIFSLDPATLHRSYMPPMQSWTGTPYAQSPLKVESLSSMSDDEFAFDLAPEPEFIRSTRRSNRRAPSCGSLVDDEWDMEETITDANKLKGVHWPGMAMFDSATPEMKRKRNQKKAYSVVRQLENTSAMVEATELVFDATGLLRRQRAITGNPELEDDDSLLSGEATPEPELPVKKKPTRRPRQALVERHVNTGRVLRRPESRHPSLNRSRKRGPYYDGPDEQEDDELTYGRPRPKKRTGLSIHRDNSGPNITFDQPASFNYLTSGFSRNALQSHPTNTQPTFSQNPFGHSHQRQPSYGFGSFRPTTSGNGVPPANFASFGHLNTQTLFQHSALPIPNGQSALQAFQQQFGAGPQNNFSNDNNPMFQNPTHYQPQAA